jgi:putative peptidoglycan lipid II flippase
MSATLNAALLYITLHQQGVFVLSRTSVVFILRVVIASAAMGGLIYYRDKGLAFFELSLSTQMLEVGMTISMSVVLFLITMLILGMRPRHFRSGGD